MASLKETLHKCPWDLLAISALTVLVVCVMIVLHVHAEVFFGLSRYLPLFLCGAMASGGLYLGHSSIIACVMATLCTLTSVVVYFLHETLGPLGKTVLFISIFVYYFSGVGIGVRRHGSVSYHRTMSAMCVQCLITVPHFVCLLKCSRSRPQGRWLN